MTATISASALRTIATERAGLDALHEAIGNGLAEPFIAAVEMIRAASGRVIVTGMGKSGHVGRKIVATLASTGTPSYFVHPAEASHGDLGMVQPEDVVIALSWSGEAAELSAIVGYTRRFRVGLIAITANRDSALGREADIALVLPKALEACPNGLAPTTSTTMQMALGDALAVALLEARGFSRQDFYVYHPGGKLGAQLKTVATIMHSGERLPVVGETAAMADVVSMITAKGFGCAIVIDADGKLTGVVTDGDLRRKHGAGWGGRLARDVMTRDPRKIAPDALTAEALEMVNRLRVTALIVADAQDRPVGLVHVHDLLALGVA
ncbi:Arabinose 5-phosphate isomerase KdsD [Bosea sp. 62]|uniref:KpsF/GutQ family sugar-phosphate isomerase n=1 Tax=unclassified Bosea (in: a-proteobacteria) TaxID=2653178 RepID=UPI00125262E7|nr:MULTISPECIES: KpsF/GutQ family sugar-phosphate isomerase [unclassified Bosea (in: a-proteobacteria)]CAD5250545.1 Arabinose 5-phosphate isomerase KdsD [Bosea sp. 7B]CAD5281339.1 Arabinose 5-phosphate isomerase KdsD [Bosea sp. 21B]CAD5283016.1 Arabinose 5-phosphate isomerase KdsD [Bosea sp. 46]VVT52367.1 Arabinose 5-phosphate isomerase KdsD [Bosea sp. EC-HK365B]VXB24724.1 Arabinose 5-phosphate isomerase KdsD [Bosea sp. 62]